MLTIGHIAFGYLTSLFLAKLFHISSYSPYYNILILIGIIASIIPDIDFFRLFYKHRSLKLQKNDTHRKYLTHIPLFWLTLSILIYIISILSSNELIRYSSFFILAGSVSHLIGDSLEYGIRWLWPFSKKQYIIHKIPKENFNAKESLLGYYWKFFSQIYIRNWTFYVELIIIIVSLIFLI